MCPSTPIVSVIIATYKRGDFLLDTLDRVLANDYPCFEVVVVDQTPEYAEEIAGRLAARQRHEFSYLKLAQPSLTVARNVGLRHSTGAVVIFCDDDVIVQPDYIASHARCYDDPQVGAVAGRVLSQMDAAMSDPSGQIGHVRPDGSFTANFHLTQRCEVDFGMGCNMSFRRSALVEAGGFDERYNGGFYREEGDAFARVKRLGYKVIFEPATALEHLVTPEGGCRKDKYLPRMYSVFRNETLFYLNCREHRRFPRFVYRLLRWMYATVRTHHYSIFTMTYFTRALLAGIGAYFFQRPNRISARMQL